MAEEEELGRLRRKALVRGAKQRGEGGRHDTPSVQ